MTLPSIAAPQSREEIVAAMEKLHAEADAYWNAFDTQTFFRPLGTAWSPADNVRHLTKSTRPVAMALKAPKLVLRWKFGKPKHASMPFDAVRLKYDSIPEKNAGSYAPSSRVQSDLDSWRRQIMAERADAKSQLVASIGKWNEHALDSYQLPHPILGPLTVREMLFFTLYHQLHHMKVVERRRTL